MQALSFSPVSHWLESQPAAPHVFDMQTDFSLFRERLAEACRARNTTESQLCRSIGLGARHAIDLDYAGIKAIEIYRLAQIAHYLNVSTDWLLYQPLKFRTRL